jgi:hypothetical protein
MTVHVPVGAFERIIDIRRRVEVMGVTSDQLAGAPPALVSPYA